MSETNSNVGGPSASTNEQSNGKPSREEILSKPILTPPAKGPEHPFDPRPGRHVSWMVACSRLIASAFNTPTLWVRENIVLPNRGPKYYYYHKKYRRALPIDECYLDDVACIYEADLEYKRIHMIDNYTLDILRQRRDDCHFWNSTNKGHYVFADECKELADVYDREETNYFIKYGELHHNAGVIHAYIKQKHRMIVERRVALMKELNAKEVE